MSVDMGGGRMLKLLTRTKELVVELCER